jgi:hypothetical protein
MSPFILSCIMQKCDDSNSFVMKQLINLSNLKNLKCKSIFFSKIMKPFYSGILPCFLHGFSAFFVFRISKSSHILFLVFGGSRISSINPLWAAMKGFANLDSELLNCC